MTIKKWLLVGLILVAGFIAIMYLLNFDDACGHDIYAEVFSPDGQYKAVVFQYDCGATTGFSTHISIITATEVLNKGAGNIFIIDGAPNQNDLGVNWLNNRHLAISGADRDLTFKAESTWGMDETIKIAYPR